MNNLILEEDLLDLSEETKGLIKNIYHEWCLANHPDKTDTVNEDALYVIKEYGEAFLRVRDNIYQQVWMYMGYAAVSFHGINLHEIKQ